MKEKKKAHKKKKQAMIIYIKKKKSHRMFKFILELVIAFGKVAEQQTNHKT
jgi:hypothetical protein